jgi:phage gp46-like protein
MPDITIVVGPDGRADWSVGNGGIVTGGDLVTAIYVSIFSWGVLPADQAPPDGTGDPRGWWGDTYEDRPIGSLLWTLQRAVISDRPSFLARAKQLVVLSVDWIEADGVASSVDVSCWFPAPETLGIDVAVMQPTGLTRAKFEWAWQGV